MTITEYDGCIHNLIKRFQNITYIDPSITIDDLWGEAYIIYSKLLNTDLSCKFITALTRQVEQRFLDMYRVAKRADARLDREQFIANFAARAAAISRIQFNELPTHLKNLVERIYNNPEEIGRALPGPGINKNKLIKYLTKELKWQRQTAIEFAVQVNQKQRKTTFVSSLTAQI